MEAGLQGLLLRGDEDTNETTSPSRLFTETPFSAIGWPSDRASREPLNVQEVCGHEAIFRPIPRSQCAVHPNPRLFGEWRLRVCNFRFLASHTLSEKKCERQDEKMKLESNPSTTETKRMLSMFRVVTPALVYMAAALVSDHGYAAHRAPQQLRI